MDFIWFSWFKTESVIETCAACSVSPIKTTCFPHPFVSMEEIRRHHEGLIALAGVGVKFKQLIRGNNLPEAGVFLTGLKTVFREGGICICLSGQRVVTQRSG